MAADPGLATVLARMDVEQARVERRERRWIRVREALRREQRLARRLVLGGSSHAGGLVPPQVLRAAAGLMGQGWCVVALAADDFVYTASAAADRPDPPACGWSEIALELNEACPGEEGRWFSVDLPEAGLRADGTAIRAEGRAAGVAAWLHTPAAPLTRRRRRWLDRLAQQTSLRLAAVQQRAERLGFLFATLKSLAAAVDAKDPYTRGHSERVHYLAMRIGAALGLDPRALEDLSWAALLHDIGKITTPTAILTKPARLDPDEWAQIRRHPDQGCALIAPIRLLTRTLPAIRHHHERFDGTGYPGGLAGESIPRMARILAAADAFDAITSERPYSRRRSCAEAIEILRALAGRQFDPVVVEAALRVVAEELARGALAFEVGRR